MDIRVFVSILPTPTEQTTTKNMTMKHLESDQLDDFQVHMVYYIILGIVILTSLLSLLLSIVTIRDFYFRPISQYHNSESYYALLTNPVHQANIIELPHLEGRYEDMNEAPAPPPLPTTWYRDGPPHSKMPNLYIQYAPTPDKWMAEPVHKHQKKTPSTCSSPSRAETELK
ncbi:hypothetical protein J6590_088466 [Homalodisca vitripennis]|nr:hypothetical protein J6590_088466 [Homalodisca vitripennis]